MFDVQCCQSVTVIRNSVYRFMCRLESSSNYIIRDILSLACVFHQEFANIGTTEAVTYVTETTVYNGLLQLITMYYFNVCVYFVP